MVLFEIFWWEETWENDLNVGKKKVESICWEDPTTLTTDTNEMYKMEQLLWGSS